MKFKSIQPFDLWGIRHTVNHLRLHLSSCEFGARLFFFSPSVQIQPGHTKITRAGRRFTGLLVVMGTGTHFAGMGIFGMPVFIFFGHGQHGHCPFQNLRAWALNYRAWALNGHYFDEHFDIHPIAGPLSAFWKWGGQFFFWPGSREGAFFKCF